MFDKLFRSLRPEPVAKEQAEDDLSLALAALLVEGARADASYDDEEKRLIDQFLASRFSLSVDEAADLRARAETAQENAPDIQRFTKLAKQMTHEEKCAFLEELWTIFLSDGARDPYEEMTARRICGLIYLDDRESGEARARAVAKLSS